MSSDSTDRGIKLIQVARGLLCLSVLSVTLLLTGPGPTAAHAQQQQIIVDAKPLEPGEIFSCRIAIEVRTDGELDLRQFDIIAKVYRGQRELASTGAASGSRPIIGTRRPGGWHYQPLPLQFELSAEHCNRADGLRIVFARCVFGDRPAEDCLGNLRFAGAKSGDPLFRRIERNID